MRIFHRFTHTVSAGIESLLDQVENQEAVARASIQDIEQGAARVRGHRKRCERRIAELEARLDALATESELWKQRAARFRDDREKALECVRRHLACAQSRTAHLAELEQQRCLRDKIALDQQAIDAKLIELRTRCAALSSRQARCAAESGPHSAADVERVFDRWEARLDGAEGVIEGAPSVDYFAQALGREEDRVRTEAELERILAESAEVSS
jgi:phage shock protein A